MVADVLEQFRVEVVLGHDVPHGPNATGTDIGSGIIAICDVKREMPLDIETELFDRLLVGQIVHLLENHNPHHGK